MLTKYTLIDQITITENGTILYRECTKILEDNVELTRSYHRSSLTPGQSLTEVPAQIIAYCNLAWTPEVLAMHEKTI